MFAIFSFLNFSSSFKDQNIYISKDDFKILNVARVLCIYFMIFTHIKYYPGSIVDTGILKYLGNFTNEHFGRASVATLSLVSGYLLTVKLQNLCDISVTDFAYKKFKTIMVPFFVWNLIYIGFVVFSFLAVGHQHRAIDIFSSGTTAQIFNMLTAAFGTPANFSLHFLRDLFVSSIALALTMKMERKWWIYIYLILIIASLSIDMQPVIYRPLVLTFLAAGALVAYCGIGLREMASGRTTVLLAAYSWGLLYFIGRDTLATALSPTAEEVILRISVVTATLLTAGWLSTTRLSRVFDLLVPLAFLCYLLHLPVTSALWTIWGKISPGNTSISYAVYYLTAPFVAFIAAALVRRWARNRPGLTLLLGVKSR